MRNLSQLIETMLLFIPSNDVLVERLKSVKSSSNYAPPEMQSMWFRQTAQVLYERFGNDEPTEVWVKVISAIWMDKPITLVKELNESL